MNNREHITSLKNQNTALGVLTDTELILVDVAQGKRVLRSILFPLDARELDGLLEYLWQSGLTSVWVLPATKLSRMATLVWLEQVSQRWVMIVHSDPSEPTRPICVLFWPKGSDQRGARRLTLAFPEYAGWNWELADARSLLATVTYLDQVLARPMLDSSDLIAHQLLTDLTRDYPIASLRSSPVDLHSLLSSDGTPIPLRESACDLVWMRPLTREEQHQRYLHKYTHLSHYLEAGLTGQLGTGTPQYSSSGRAYDGIRPGVWRISAERAGSLFDGQRLPSCLDGEWMSTPQVKCCQDTGYQIQVREGYYWQEAHTLLKQWATSLWQAGERLHTHPQLYRHAQARTNASRTITRLAQQGVTILAEEQTAGGWARPDWWAQIVGRSRATLFAHLVSLVRKGTMPVLIDRDAFWTSSTDPTPLTDVPGLFTASKCKGYTAGYEAPLPLSQEVKATFRTAEHADQLA